MPADFPRRIVCLTDETTETLYLLGEQDRIVGVSGFTTRPPEARRKPRVSAFSSANFDSILKLTPDLVLTFSDVQAEIRANLYFAALLSSTSISEASKRSSTSSLRSRAWSRIRRVARRLSRNCGAASNKLL